MQQLVIKRPLRSSRIAQVFGENKACVRPDGRIVGTKSTCPAGTTSLYAKSGLAGHTGYDIAAIHGETIVHGGTFDGWMNVEKDMQGGIGVDVISKDPLFFPGKPPTGLRPVQVLPDGFTSYVKLRYWHLKAPIGHDGKEVKFGQEIGLADNTGNSSGDHLHFAAKWCDKKGKGIDPGDGYKGSFDFTKYYAHHIYAKDSAEFLQIKPEITPKEREEMLSQLSLIRRALLLLRELVYKM